MPFSPFHLRFQHLSPVFQDGKALGCIRRNGSWEKGTNENANGLLRDFFPKGGSLDGATDAEVNAAYAMLNRRPHKRLGWKCLQEVFCSQVLHLL